MNGLVRPLRRAGRGRLADGSVVTWTLAEGTKGRRWREVVVRDGAMSHALLLEASLDRRFAHLELATGGGLLTVHPEGDDTLHGNVVTEKGVAHVVGLPWSDDAVVLVQGSPIAAAVAAFAAALSPAAGEGFAPARGASLPCLRIRSDLTLEPGFVHLADLPAVRPDGLPILPSGAGWPLELDETG